jgi:hypothetical protein
MAEDFVVVVKPATNPEESSVAQALEACEAAKKALEAATKAIEAKAYDTAKKALTEATKAFEVKPPECAKTDESAKAIDATKPPESIKPAEMAKIIETAKPPEAAKAVEAAKPAEVAKIIETAKAPEAPKAAEADKAQAPEAPKAAEADKAQAHEAPKAEDPAPEAAKAAETDKAKAPEAAKAAETDKAKAPEAAKAAETPKVEKDEKHKMAKDDKDEKYAIVVSIDLGTAQTGYAFAYPQDPKNFHTHLLNGRPKEPTILLLNEKQECVTFGEDALVRYQNELDNGNTKMLMFRTFKMALFGDNITWNKQLLKIKAENGQEVEAFLVITRCLEYLKNTIMKRLACASSLHTGDAGKLPVSKIKWMLSIPAIWSNESKEFMRDAAFKAGLIETQQSRNLQLVLESESCSIECFRHETSLSAVSVPNFTYLVVDLGGGTGDFTVHKINQNNTLEEVVASTGGPWGSTYVDQAFVKLLQDIIGEEALRKFQNECTGEWIEMLRDFEIIKVKMSYENQLKNYVVPVRQNFLRLAKVGNNGQPLSVLVSKYVATQQELKKKQIQPDVREKAKEPSPTTKEQVREKPDLPENPWISVDVGLSPKFKLSFELMESLFAVPLDAIVKHVKNILQENKAITHVFLCGGFSSSNIVQTHLRRALSAQIQIVVPPNTDSCVLSGSLAYAFNNKVIASRICKYTYGIETTLIKNNTSRYHKHETRGYRDGKGTTFLQHRFIHCCTAGSSIPMDYVWEDQFTGSYDNQSQVEFNFQRTQNRELEWVCEDPNIQHAATITVVFPNAVEHPKDRPIKLQINFGGSEITLCATDVVSKKTFEASLRFDKL